MEKVTQMNTVVFEKAQGGEFRWITISTVLLALGAILHLVAPSIGGVTPNFLIATYVVAILLVRPTYRQCLGIGLVAGLIEMMTSKSAFPYGNLISEMVGATLAYLLATYGGRWSIKGYSLLPLIGGFLVTLGSGITFVYLLHLVVGIPLMMVYVLGGTVIAMTALMNLFLTGLLYYPAYRLLVNMGVLSASSVKTTDHSGYAFLPAAKGQVVVEHLTYAYEPKADPALRDISLTIAEGEFLVITGPSGCGKTTLAMSFCGAVPHFYGGRMQGMVFVENQAITQVRMAELAMSVGTVLADYDTQLVTMTVEEEVAFAMENRGFDEATIATRTREVLAQVGLSGLEERKVTDLSGGQRQRLVVAAALVTEPSLLILDEPTSALDPAGRRDLYALLGKLHKELGMTIIVVEAMLEEVLPYADRLALLLDGQLVTMGPIEDTLAYMYEQDVYAQALPQWYVFQRMLAEDGHAMVGEVNRPLSLADMGRRISSGDVAQLKIARKEETYDTL